jgi:hypothetical protein
MKNPNCDGVQCHADVGEVRLLPFNGNFSLAYCYGCYLCAMQHRMSLNKQRHKDDQLPLPKWADLKVYDPDLPKEKVQFNLVEMTESNKGAIWRSEIMTHADAALRNKEMVAMQWLPAKESHEAIQIRHRKELQDKRERARRRSPLWKD